MFMPFPIAAVRATHDLHILTHTHTHDNTRVSGHTMHWGVGFVTRYFIVCNIIFHAQSTPEWVVQELHATYHFGVTHICADRYAL